jgi:phage terminase small subunit
MGGAVNAKLTNKQKVFAMELAKGETGASAYRKAYSSKGKATTQAVGACKLRKKPNIAQMVEAYSLALEGQAYQTPAALRALVIESLVSVIIDPDANHSQVVAAAKVLGTVTEVAAFTERKEVTTITSSETARAKVMQQLREMMRTEAVDIVENDAQSLVDELSAPAATPTTPIEPLESLAHIHTIPLKRPKDPLKRSPQKMTPSPLDESAPPSVATNLETPPGHVFRTNGAG